MTIQTDKQKIMAAIQRGDFVTARKDCQKASKRYPGDAELWYLLSAICGQQQDYPSAEKYSRKAIEINPGVASVYFNLAIAQRGQGKHESARRSLEKVLSLEPGMLQAELELGNLALYEQDIAQAEQRFQTVLSQVPQATLALFGLARCKQARGDHTGALEILNTLLGRSDTPVELDSVSAVSNESIGNYHAALDCYQNMRDRHGDNTQVLLNTGRMLSALSRYDEAEKVYSHALKIDNNCVEVLVNLGLLYLDTKQAERALPLVERAAELRPDDEKVLYNLAKVFNECGHYLKARDQYRKVLDINPEMYRAGINLGNLYLLCGEAGKAAAVYKSTCEQSPQSSDACSNMLLSYNYLAELDPETVFQSHVSWGRRQQEAAIILKQTCSRKSSNDPLRIGYVSPDFRYHSVSFFLECILRFANPAHLENYCYSDVRHKDPVTNRFKSYSQAWCDSFDMSDEELAEQIVNDEIDVLVDLCGHMANNRLAVFAMKPAPVQVTYLGYPNTTGLDAIDYRIVDSYTDGDTGASMMSETPLFLDPGFLCYTPEQGTPEVATLPMKVNGHITFGSFNNLAKITDEVMDTWARLLISIDHSRIRVKARQFSDPGVRSYFNQRFISRGIGEERVDLLGYSDSINQHLQEYGKIDVALDCFPYNGTTTTFESLWMGVPVITLEGSVHAGRVGVSIMNNVGLRQFVASSLDEYVEIATGVCADVDALAEIRRNLRSQMNSSSLMDGPQFVERYEAALLQAYQEKQGREK